MSENALFLLGYPADPLRSRQTVTRKQCEFDYVPLPTSSAFTLVENNVLNYSQTCVQLVSLAAVFWMSRNAPPKEREGKGCVTFGKCQGDRYVLCRKYKATENFGKLSGDRNIQGDRYVQVSFAQNIRQLKILESCPVTVIYRAVIYRLAVSQIDRCQARLLKTVFSNDSYFFCFINRALNLPC